jgi:hypothetical protein
LLLFKPFCYPLERLSGLGLTIDRIVELTIIDAWELCICGCIYGFSVEELLVSFWTGLHNSSIICCRNSSIICCQTYGMNGQLQIVCVCILLNLHANPFVCVGTTCGLFSHPPSGPCCAFYIAFSCQSWFTCTFSRAINPSTFLLIYGVH